MPAVTEVITSASKKAGTIIVANQHHLPVLPILGAVLVVLKALGYITWSWWWVTLPFWAPIALLFAFLGAIILVGLLVLLGLGIWAIYDHRKALKNQRAVAQSKYRSV